jgi:membrane protein
MTDYLKLFFKAISDDNIDSMASSVAYAFMLSIFPFLIGVFAILQLLQESTNIVAYTVNTFDEFFPLAIRDFILTSFRNVSYERTGSILIISLAASIGFGSYGFKAIFVHLSRILRDERPRPFIWTSLLSILFAAGAIVVIAVSFVLLLLSGGVIHSISDKLAIGKVIPALLNFLRFPFVLVSLIVCSAIVYRIGPRKTMPWSCIAISSLTFSCGWIAATFLFGIYLARFARYNLIYGTLAGVIVFLIWMYISAFIFLSSAEIGRIRMEHLEKLAASRFGDSDDGKDSERRGAESKE